MIHFYNVTKLYGNGVKALSDVTFRIRRGEFVFLVGQSGAGKSTLMKMIYREVLPTRGQVMFNGKNIMRLRSREVPHLRRKVGMVFQDFRLLPNKTAAENVSFALEVTGASRSYIKRVVPAVLQKVGMLEKAEHYPAQLSGGEQQRVGIARAIVNNPVIIVADEPTGNLDPQTAKEIMDLFMSINRSGTTILMATHAWDVVENMNCRVISMAKGRIVTDQEGGVGEFAR